MLLLLLKSKEATSGVGAPTEDASEEEAAAGTLRSLELL